MKINAEVTLLSSVSHIGETLGIEAEFHRIKIILPSGQTERIPTITGNSIRGQLRDAAALYLIKKLAIPPMSIQAFYLLFSGGSLTKTGSKAISLEHARLMRNLLPPLSLLGGAVGNHILPGRLNVGMFIPLAFETAHLVPEYVTIPNLSIYDYMQSEAYTRRDDAKNEHYEPLLQVEESAEQIAMFEARSNPDVDRSENNTPQQMRYMVETMAAGTRLYWHMALNQANDLEQLALVSALQEWSKQPILGGKRAVGHGLCEIQFDNGWYISPNRIKLPNLEEYDAYLLENKERILEVIHAL